MCTNSGSARLHATPSGTLPQRLLFGRRLCHSHCSLTLSYFFWRAVSGGGSAAGLIAAQWPQLLHRRGAGVLGLLQELPQTVIRRGLRGGLRGARHRGPAACGAPRRPGRPGKEGRTGGGVLHNSRGAIKYRKL
eukprot:TRINITY_DN4126_c0_g1_i21.p3 TRINITY_DN4126_c0_g1~~TRINITY_DN4126_c0_g1_i21.p3  ORF type:complete len:134 (-),score=4.10 TRINITY_DN4126_c0_g1_i21:5-406(-)